MTNRYARDLRSGTEPDPRFTLANERTLLAWIRTSLALVAGGLAVYGFGEDRLPDPLVTPVAVLLLLSAAVVTVGALHRWFSIQVAMRRQQPLPLPYLALPVVTLIVVGSLAACWLVLA
jgi:putative membrane protein